MRPELIRATQIEVVVAVVVAVSIEAERIYPGQELKVEAATFGKTGSRGFVDLNGLGAKILIT